MPLDHLSSTSFQAWRTPRVLGKQLVQEYDLVLDVAADKDNSLTDVFLDGSEGSDGLTQPWDLPAGGVWCNPPYDNTAAWTAKAFNEVYILGNCERAVMLLPASIGVSWFTDVCKIAEVHLFDARIRFELPAYGDLPEHLRDVLYKMTKNGPKPKTSPGGGNALVIFERDGLTGVTGMRSAKTGHMVFDFLDGQSIPVLP